MTPNEYISLTRTYENRVEDYQLVGAALGFVAEAGEVANEVERALRGHDRMIPVDREKVMLEMGDALYNMARIADLLGISFEEIMDENAAKLKQRYGF